MKKNKQAFTLVEIMIVVLIIGLLAAIAVPSFMKARENAQKNACINNLRQIESAKDQWSIEANQTTGVAFAGDWEDYIRGGVPTCPANGTYSINNVGTNVTCSINGHVLDAN